MNSLYEKSRIVQLKTIIDDLSHRTRVYNVGSVSKRLNEQMKIAQEEYKSLTGEYLDEYMPVEESNEQASARLKLHYGAVLDNLKTLKAAVDDMAGHDKDWGAVGSMEKVNDDLVDILEFLNKPGKKAPPRK